MKRRSLKKLFLAILLSFVMSITVFFTGCVSTYRVDTSLINCTLEYKSDLPLDDISIVTDKGEVIEVTRDMISTAQVETLTDTVGKKQLTFKYLNETYTINFTVKYRVKFVVDGEVVDSQLVMNMDEVQFPENPTKTNYDFTGWGNVPEELTDNMEFVAEFKLSDVQIPLLSTTYSATYGDTLGTIELESNEFGHWEFVDDETTLVGNAGSNQFDVRFVPASSDIVCDEKIETITINVAKKVLEFKNVQNTFVYDGSAKVPSYELDVEDLEIVYTPYYAYDAINIGEYLFDLDIVDNNYTGSYSGSFEINPVVAYIYIDDMSMYYSDALPTEYTYSVKDENGNALAEDLVDLMGITINKIKYINGVGDYSINGKVDNKNFDVTIYSGYLKVQKVELNLDNPSFVNGKKVVYGDTLESVEFNNIDLRGTWTWQDPTMQVLTDTSVVATAVFTPEDDKNYLPTTQEIELTVEKRKIEIVPITTTYTYDGAEHTIVYRLDGVVRNEDLNDIVVEGNISETNAGDYDVVLSINSENKKYLAEVSTTLQINKASKNPNFDQNYEIEWSSTLRLSDIKLPSGYSWVEPETVIAGEGIGNVKCQAKFTPEDTDNYKIEQGLINVNVLKTQKSIITPAVHQFTYNPAGYNLINYQLPHDETNLKIVYHKNGEIVDNLTNVGEYDVELILPESEHYVETSKTIKVVINKFENTDVIIKNIDAVYEDTMAKFELPTNTTGIWTWLNGGWVGDAGQATHVAVFTPYDTTNYAARTENVVFNIAKKSVQAPTIPTRIYNGSHQVLDISDTALYTVKSNDGGTDAGKYSIILELTDAKNYEWSILADEKELVLDFEILKNQNNAWLVKPNIASWTYDPQITNNPTASAVFGDVVIEYKLRSSEDSEYVLTKPNKAGEYIARFSVKDTNNYNGLDKVEVEFSIAYIVVAVPTINSVVYNGEVQTANIPESDKYTVLSETNYTNAGTYDIVIKLNNDSYKWTDSYELERTLTFVINKVKNNDNVTTIYDAMYKDTLSKFALPTSTVGTWVWKDGANTEVGVAGVATHMAEFIPSEENVNNYETREVAVTFNIAKKVVQLPVITNKIYNGTMQFAEVSESSEYTIIENNGGIETGNYFVKFQLNDTNNYRWAGYTTERQVDLIFRILKEEANNWTAAPTLSGWTYGEEENSPIADSNYGDVVVEYKLKGADDSTYTTTKPSKAGDYVVRFKVNETDDYNGLTQVLEFSIGYVVVAVPTVNQVVYNGEVQHANIPQSDKYTILTGTNYTNAGSYDIILKLNNDSYKWTDSHELERILTFVINKVVNTDIVATEFDAIYKDTLSKFTLPTSEFGTWVWKDGADTEVGNAGTTTHIAQFVPTDKDNYEAREVEVTFNIAKKVVQEPTISAKTYTGVKEIADVADTDVYTVVQNNGGIETGQYDVILELIDPVNYRWAGKEDETQISKTFNIVRNANNNWTIEPSIASWTYGQTEGEASAEAVFGEVVIEYKSKNADDSTYTTVKPSKAGRYIARFIVEDTDDYNGLNQTVEFEIGYVSVAIPTIAESIYTGSVQTANIPDSEYYSVIVNNQVVNAGTYNVVIKLNNDSYKWTDSYELTKTLRFVINKVSNTDVVPTEFEAIYKDTLSKFTLPTSATGTWVWKDGASTEVGNAGTATHIAQFVPTDKDNYEAREVEVTFNIAKKVVQVPVIANKIYNGTMQFAEVSESSEYTIIENNGGIETGNYFVKLQLNDTNNYRWDGYTIERQVDLIFRILKEEANNWTAAPTLSGWTYGEEENSPIADSNYGDVVVEYKLKGADDSTYTTTKPSKAGDYVVRFKVNETDNYNGLTQVLEFSIGYVVVAVPSISKVTYNGLAQTANLQESDKYTILSDLTYTNAGTHNIVVRLNDDSYKWTDSYELERTLTFVINKVSNTDVVPTEFEGIYKDTLSKFALPTSATGTWVWKEGENAEVGNAGVATHIAQFVPTDTDNYETREVEITFNIAKKVVQVPVIAPATYTGNVQVANIVDTDVYMVVENDGGVDVGEYTVILELVDSANYRWAGKEDEAQISTIFNIVRNANNDWLVEPTIADWKYGEAAASPSAEAIYGDVVVEYKLKNADDNTYTTTKPSKAGTYIARFVVEETDDYNGLVQTVEFDIAYIVVSVPTIAESVYTGSAQTANIPNSDYYDVITNNEVTNAGTYNVVIKLNNDSYKWTDSYELERTLTFVINKVVNTDVVPTEVNAVYKDTLSKFNLPTSATGTWVWRDGADTEVGNAGTTTHIAQFVPTDKDNYGAREVEVTFNIAKKVVETPQIDSVVYNNTEQTAVVEESELYIVYSEGKGTNAGRYDVVLELTDGDNYCWSKDNNDKQITIPFVIEKNTNNTWSSAPTMIGWTYGETANNPIAEALFGDVVVEYKLKGAEDSTYTNVKPSKAGEYTVRFTVNETDNYSGIDYKVEFDIKYFVVAVPNILEKTYNGTSQITIPANDYYDVLTNANATNAGTYNVVIRLNNDSYKWTDSYELTKTLRFVINKVSNTDVVTTEFDAVYKETLSKFTLPTSATGTWVWKDGADAEVGNAGTATHIAQFVPTDTDNYEAREVEATFNIAKKVVQEPTISAKTYTGVKEIADVADTDIYTIVENNGGVDAGEYIVVLELVDAANYRWKKSEEKNFVQEFVILKNENNIWSTNPSMAGWTYGETANNPIAEALFGDVVVEYKLKGADDSTYTNVKPSKAGDYVARFKVNETENFVGLDAVCIDFSIEYIVVADPTIEESVYTGSAQTANIPNSEYYDVITNNEVTNAGTYNVIIKLNNDSYKWMDSYELERTLTFVINKVVNTDVVPTEFSAVYKDTLSKFALPTSATGTWVWKEGVDVEVGNAGTATHIAQFIPTDAVNYEGREASVTFNIAKKGIQAPILAAQPYSGVIQKAAIEDTDEYTVKTNNGGMQKGTYEVVLELKDNLNYYWIGNSSSTETIVTFNIVKNNNNTWKVNPSLEGWTYLDTPNEPIAQAMVGEYYVEYKLQSADDSTYTSSKPSKAGTYIARFVVDETDNYSGIDYKVEFDIEYFVVAVPNILEKTYNGTSQITIPANDYYDVLTNANATNAGSYDVVIKLKDDSYKWPDSYELEKTLTFVMNKVINTDNITTEVNVTYKDTLSTVKLPVNSTGTWVWIDGADAEVGNAGTATHIVEFIPTDAVNYEGREVSITFNIAKKVIDAPVITAATYNGSEQTANIATSDLYSVVTEGKGTNAGSYDVVLQLTDSDNYWWSLNNDNIQTTLQFNILKYNDNTWETLPSIEGWTYLDEANTPSAKAIFGDYVVEYKVKGALDTTYTTNVPTNAGTYVARFSVTDTSNYNGLTQTVEFVIEKLVVNVPTIAASVYTGSAQLPEINESYIDVVTTTGFVNAGTHNIDIKLNNANYKWSDSEELQRQVQFTINKATDNNWTAGPTMNTYEYSPTPNAANAGTATAKYGSVVVTYSAKGANSFTTTIPNNVGAYEAKFEVAETDNYNGISKVVEFSVTQATPVLTASSIGTYYENAVTSAIINSKLKANTDATFTFALPKLVSTSNAAQQAVSFDVTITPKDTLNYKTVTAKASITLKAVCYIGSTYYGSIENAIANAVSGNNIMVIPNTTGKVTIASNVTIPSGVTLTLPYAATDGVNKSATATLTVKNFDSLQMTNQVVILQGVTVTNNGTIMIAGELSGGGGGYIGGHTGGKFAEIEMQENAKIVSTGTITCYGFIDENSNNNGSLVEIKSGSITMPFVVNDFRGGSYMKKANDQNVVPFNHFEFRNVVAKMIIYSSGQLLGNANLYAGEQHNNTTGKVIGNSKDYLIQLNSGARMECKYTPVHSTEVNKKVNNIWTKGSCKIDIYGGATSNSFMIKLSIKLWIIPISVTIDTASRDFPLTWRHKITLHDGAYKMQYSFKMMPGHEFVVEQDATLEAGSINIYSSYEDTSLHAEKYDSTLPGAKFVLRGSMTATSVGGRIVTDTDGANITVANTSVTCKEMDGESTKNITNSLVLYYAPEVNGTINYDSLGEAVPVTASTKYKLVDGKWVVA